MPVPAEFLKPAGSPRDPAEGTPATVFRYDLMWEFISAIVERRPAVPSFYDGLNAQIVADAVLESHQNECGSTRRWRRSDDDRMRSGTARIVTGRVRRFCDLACNFQRELSTGLLTAAELVWTAFVGVTIVISVA